LQTSMLGQSDLALTTIGLGTWAIGGSWIRGWGVQNDADSIQAIEQALNLGINWIDTAPVYGLGHAEKIVGKVVSRLSCKPLISTKCGQRWDGNGHVYGSLRKKSVFDEADESLKRLGVDVIDLYQIHWPNPEEEVEEGWDAVARLVEAGKVRFGGVSNFSVSQMDLIRPIHPVTSLQPPYSMLKREIEDEILPYCGEHKTGVICYSPMQKGLLTGKVTPEWIMGLSPDDHRKRDPMFLEPELTVNMHCVEQLKRIAEAYEKTVSQMAIAWVLRRGEITSAIVGARSQSQIEETVAAGDWILDDGVIDRIDQILLEREDKLTEIKDPPNQKD